MKKLVVIIPALNEEVTVGTVIGQLPKTVGGFDAVETVVIDDGSTDATADRAKSAGARVVSFGAHRGLSAAFQQGVHEALLAGADVMVSIDGDGQFEPKDIPKLAAPVSNGTADVATASRFKDRSLAPKMTGAKRWGNARVASLVSSMTGTKLHDVSCGFRAYSRETLLNLNVFGAYTYTQETLIGLIMKGFRVVEIPIAVRGQREFGKSRIARSVWQYGFQIAHRMFRTMLDYKPLRMFSVLGLAVFLVGFALDLFVGLHYLSTHSFTPYKSYAFVGGFLNVVGFLIVIVGLVADMLNRTRIMQDRLLYYSKKQFYDRPDGVP